MSGLASAFCPQQTSYLPSQDNDLALDLEAATAVAGIVAAICGPGQPHTTPAECRLVNAAFFADLVQVHCADPHRCPPPWSSLTLTPLVMDVPTSQKPAVTACFMRLWRPACEMSCSWCVASNEALSL